MIDKKIGILNFHFSTNNYGAVIQAYALQQHLILIGYNVENIDLKPNTFWKTKEQQVSDSSIKIVTGNALTWLEGVNRNKKDLRHLAFEFPAKSE